MNLQAIIVQCKTQVLSMIRMPSFTVPIFTFPLLFYLFFALPSANDPVVANQQMVAYMIYAMLAVAFYQVSGAIVDDRLQSWEPYLWTLPHFHQTRLIGRLVTGFFSAVLSTSAVAVIAYVFSPVQMNPLDWVLLVAMLLIGSVPFVFLAVALGYLLHPKAASPVSSLLFFSLAYAGALWTPPDQLPGWLQQVSHYLPTRQWAEVAWSAVFDHQWLDFHWFGLLIYGGIFAVLAFFAVIRNDVLQRY